MKTYQRQYPLFSLCGLNCGLCPMYQSTAASKCPGCGGEEFYPKHPTCAIVTCSQRHGGVEYCYRCDEYPCKRYDSENPFDSFITYRKVFKDFDKAKNAGLDAYQAELNEKVEILQWLLGNCNDGRQKNFFCIAINLLELQDVKCVMQQIAEALKPEHSIKVRSSIAVRLFQAIADERAITLKLNKKKSAKEANPTD